MKNLEKTNTIQKTIYGLQDKYYNTKVQNINEYDSKKGKYLDDYEIDDIKKDIRNTANQLYKNLNYNLINENDNTLNNIIEYLKDEDDKDVDDLDDDLYTSTDFRGVE